MNNQFDNKTVLITGSSGSWGTELISQLLKTNVKEIRGYARGEFLQVSSERLFNDHRLKIIIGDVRDFGELKHACQGVDYVFHLSALKHVPICELQPYESIKTNISGTRNIVRACVENNVKIMIDVSSDKAVLPINTYGLTKAIGEKLTLNASLLNSQTKFMVIRGGNVMGTAGSVIPLWIDQIKRYNQITLTDKRMTRYFITLSEAIKLLFVAVESNINSGLFVINMPACKIIDLAEVLIEYYGNKDTKIKEIGMRPGEKLHELLISEHESPVTYKYNKNYYFISRKIVDYPKVNFKQFDSSTNLMNKEQIKDLLDRGGFLK